MSDKRKYHGFKLNIDEIAIITFNHPKINIFSIEVLTDFVEALNSLYSLHYIKVLVITSEGKNFMAGADIKEMATFSSSEANLFSKLFHNVMNLVEKFPRPVIAAVNGFALGGGCELILACDIVIASETAIFGQPEIKLGIIPGAGGTQRLHERIGKLKAKELIFTGREVHANEALSMGLINKVVAKDKLFDEAIDLAKSIASHPIYCLEAAKTLIDAGSMDKGRDKGMDKEIEEFSKMFSFDEQKQLMGKFINRC